MSLETDLSVMARIIREHPSYVLSIGGARGRSALRCTGPSCGLYVYDEHDDDWVPDEIHASHVAFELVKAGIGPIPKGLSVEYGSQWMTLIGPSDVQSDGPVPKESWYDPSTHKRLVTPWEYV